MFADLEQLLRWMLCKDPTQRCTVTQLMAHAWTRQPVAVANYVFHEIVDCGTVLLELSVSYNFLIMTKIM